MGKSEQYKASSQDRQAVDGQHRNSRYGKQQGQPYDLHAPFAGRSPCQTQAHNQRYGIKCSEKKCYLSCARVVDMYSKKAAKGYYGDKRHLVRKLDKQGQSEWIIMRIFVQWISAISSNGRTVFG